jgi:hypothetical protein
MPLSSSPPINGWDAQIIMGSDEAALLHLWRQKRGQADPACLSDNLIAQLSMATAELNRRYYRFNTGKHVNVVGENKQHRSFHWMCAMVEGFVGDKEALFQSFFQASSAYPAHMAAERCMSVLQHKLLVTGYSRAVASILTGDSKWIEISVVADSVYQTALIAAEKAFSRSVQTGSRPQLFGVVPRRSSIEAVRILDLSGTAPQVAFDTKKPIDKGSLAFSEPRRLRDKDHLTFVATRPCTICGRRPSDAHHLRFAQPRALGRKVSDEFTVPLCRLHHREAHQAGNEARWWSNHRVDPLTIAESLWSRSRLRTQRTTFDARLISPGSSDVANPGQSIDVTSERAGN